MQARDKIIFNLKKQVKIFPSTNSENKNLLINNISTNLKSLRIVSINVVLYFIKFWESSSYDILNGKYYLEKVNKLYAFDRNYLIKVFNLNLNKIN